jgi:hypothetical protein
MQRIKSLDTFRGFIMLAMVWVHLCDWWLREEDIWFSNAVVPILKLIFGPGFLLLAGISISLSYRKSLIKITRMDDFNYDILKKEYLFRATFILIVALGYNSFVALQFMNPLDLWKWFMLLTMSISLPYQGQMNVNGIIYYLFYNSIDVIPFPHYFSYILIGTIIGEVIFDIYKIEHQKERKLLLKKKITIPSLMLGILLIILSVILDSRLSLERTSFIWILFAMGINLTLLALFLGFEDFKLRVNKRRLKFLFYYSYYSLTIYLVHNISYFFFLNQLYILQFWIFVTLYCLVFGLVLRLIHNKYGPKFSIKVQVSRLSSALAKRLETI